MRLVLLTGEGPEHRYVAARLARAFGDALVAVVVARPPARPAMARLQGYWRRYTLRQLASRLAARVYAKATAQAATHDATVRRVLGDDADEQGGAPSHLTRIVPGHNSRECVELLASLQPEVIAVYGTMMLKGPVLSAASRAMLNMHTGLSPRYRGSDTIFWPLHNGEPESVGVTIHLLDAGLDSGAIVATGRPPIAETDDESALFAKAVMVGTDLYVSALREAGAGTLRTTPQDLSSGKEYRFVDRTVGAEMRVKRMLAGGLLRRFVRDAAGQSSTGGPAAR